MPNPADMIARLLRRLGAGDTGKRLAGGSAASFAYKIGSMGAAFVATMILTRLIGADGYGAYAWAMSWVYLLLIPALLGLDRLLLREIPTLVTQEEWGLLRGLLRTGGWGVLLLSLLLGGFAALVGMGLVRTSPTITPAMGQTLYVALLLLPVMALQRLRQTVLLGFHRIVLGQAGELGIAPAANLLILAGFALVAPSLLTPPWAVASQGVAALLGLLFLWLAGRPVIPDEIRRAPARTTVRPWLTAALPMLLAAGMQVLNQRIDILMVGGLLGAEDAGLYAVANRGAMLILLIFYAVNQPLAPVVAELHGRGDTARLQNLITRSTRVMVALAVPAAAGMIVFAVPFLRIFGQEFDAGRVPLIIMSAAQVVAMGFGSVSTVLLMTGLERWAAAGAGISAVVNVLLNLLLIPRFGMVGAAWALAVGQVGAVSLMGIVAYTRRNINVTPFGRTL